jgi:hypothetical protein
MSNIRRAQARVCVVLATLLIGTTAPTAEHPQADNIIISVTAPPALSTLITPGRLFPSGNTLATSWSQAAAYTDVSVAVLVDSAIVGQTPTAIAYLTTRIGGDATPMDEIAHTLFTVPEELPICSASSCGAMVTLFSGLTLGPGSYFLTISSGFGGIAGWFPALNPTVVLGPGATAGASFSAHPVFYPPASAWVVYPWALNFTVTGTSTFAGTPGRANCHGQTVSELARRFHGVPHAAEALGFPSVQGLQDAIRTFCRE